MVKAPFTDSGYTTFAEGIGASVGLLLRVGSPDAVLLELFNSWTYVERWNLGSIRLRVQWAAGPRNWMVFRATAGFARANYIEAGFRRLVAGWSAEGALFVTGSMGTAIINDGGELYFGPSLGVGIEKLW